MPRNEHQIPLVVPTIFDLCMNWRSMELIESWGFSQAYTQHNAHTPLLIHPGTAQILFLYCVVKIHFVA